MRAPVDPTNVVFWGATQVRRSVQQNLRTALALLILALATPAAAQDRGPEARQTLVDLAYVLGQSHALRQVCAKDPDFFWRERMERLMDVEATEQAMRTRLVNAFNTGFNTAEAGFPKCGAASRVEAARVARRGRDLAAKLSAP